MVGRKVLALLANVRLSCQGQKALAYFGSLSVMKKSFIMLTGGNAIKLFS